MKYFFLGLIVAAAFILNIPGVNIHGFFEVPTINKHRITTHWTYSGDCPFVHKKIDIRLEETIGEHNIEYMDVIQTLQDANYGDVIVFHLAGYGGDAQQTMNLISNIRATKATTVMSVEAAVYSAHAYIAASGDELKMAAGTYLMFHMSSVLNKDCSEETRLDRGVSNVEHCEDFKVNAIKQNVELLQSFNVLTDQERRQLYLGHDVYLDKYNVYSKLLRGDKVITNTSDRSFFGDWFK